jgi:hypothetical protein
MNNIVTLNFKRMLNGLLANFVPTSVRENTPNVAVRE